MNNKSNFQWSDSLALEWAEYLRNNHGKSFPYNYALEKFKKSKEKSMPKDWQIISFHCDNCVHKDGIIKRFEGSEDCFQGGGTESYHLEKHKIHSVKRLSDGQIFTLRDGTNHGIIKKIAIVFNECYIYTTDSGYPIGQVEKIPAKLKLYTTENGVDVYEGDSYWTVSDTFEADFIHCVSRHWRSNLKLAFNSKLDSELWIFKNKPIQTTYTELKDFLNSKYACPSCDYENVLNFFKLKINP